MKHKKVVLYGQKDVLGDGVEHFLAVHAEWELVRITCEESQEVLMDRIEAEKPDVIIIYGAKCPDKKTFPYQLLDAHPEIKVITVSLENNFLEIVDKHRIWVNHVSDLYTAISE